MNTKNVLDQYLGKVKNELFAPLVEQTMAEHFSSPPPNLLESKAVWEEKRRGELMELYSGQAAVDKTCRGLDALAEDLKGHLSRAALQEISKEWERGVETWLSKVNSGEGEPAESFQEMLGISEEVLNHFYQAANRYFKHQEFEKASDAFYVIANLDPRRYNVWLALGICEAHHERFEQALISFSMACLMDSKAPYPYLYSAECCIKDRKIEEAKIYLTLAKEALEESPVENQSVLLQTIAQLNQLCQ